MEDLKEVLELVRDIDSAEKVDIASDKLITIPEGRSLVSLKPFIDEYRAAPERIETTAPLTTVQSFIDYMVRFKTADSAVFAIDNPEKPRLLGAVDFHGQGPDAAPRFVRHRATYAFPLSDQMKSWIKATNAGLINQEQFAFFLADHQYDIENPPLDWMGLPREDLDLVLNLLNLHDDRGQTNDLDLPAATDATDRLAEDEQTYVPRSAVYKLRKLRFGTQEKLMALSRGIEISINSKAVSNYNEKTGARTVHFSEDNEASSAGRKVIVPDLFFIYVPVFEGQERRLLPVRLRYRVQAGKVIWAIDLLDHNRMIRLAVRAAVEQVMQATGLPLYYGAPEA